MGYNEDMPGQAWGDTAVAVFSDSMRWTTWELVGTVRSVAARRSGLHHFHSYLLA